MVANPLTPYVVQITGTSNSEEGDNVRITVYSGGTARGSVATRLDVNKEALIDLANSDITVEQGDTVVVSHSGKALGGTSITVDNANSGGTIISVAATTVAFPSRSL